MLFVQRKFPAVTVLYIILHPFDVLASHVGIAAPNQIDISRNYYRLPTQNPHIEGVSWDTLGPYSVDSDDYTQYKIASWCVHQRWILDLAPQNGNFGLACYEDLVQKPEASLKALAGFLRSGEFDVSEAVDISDMRRPSRTTKPERIDAMLAGKVRGNWRTVFSEEPINCFREALSFF